VGGGVGLLGCGGGVGLCRWIVLPEREASEGVKLCNDELNSLMKYGMGCSTAWSKARSAN